MALRRVAIIASILSFVCPLPAQTSSYSAAVLADRPVAYYRLNESSRTTAADSSGNGRHGSYRGGVAPAPGALGSGDGAADFNGRDAYVDLPGTWGGSGWTEVTIEAWVNVRRVTSDLQAAVISGDANQFVHFQLHQNAVYNNVVYPSVYLPVIPQGPTGTWRHVALTSRSGESRVYVDGVQLGPTVTSTFGRIDPTSTLRIGGNYFGVFGTGRFFDGQIDEVAIYDRALGQSRLQAHIAARADTSPPPPPPPPPPPGCPIINPNTNVFISYIGSSSNCSEYGGDCRAGETIAFQAGVFGYSFDCGPHTFQWDFGDGTPRASGQRASHAYAAPGTYSVSLRISNANQIVDVSHSVRVTGGDAGTTRRRAATPPERPENRIGRAEIALSMPLASNEREFFAVNADMLTANGLTLTDRGIVFPVRPAAGYVVEIDGHEAMVSLDGTFRVAGIFPTAATGTVSSPDGTLRRSFPAEMLVREGKTPSPIVLEIELATGETEMSAATEPDGMRDASMLGAAPDALPGCPEPDRDCTIRCRAETKPTCCLDYDGWYHRLCGTTPAGHLHKVNPATGKSEACGLVTHAQFMGSTCFWWATAPPNGTAPGAVSGHFGCLNEGAIVRSVPLLGLKGPSCYDNHRGRICQNLDSTTLGLQLEAGPIVPNVPPPDPRTLNAPPEKTITRTVNVQCGAAPLALNLYNNTWWNESFVRFNDQNYAPCAAGGTLSASGVIRHYEPRGLDFIHFNEKILTYVPPARLDPSCGGKGLDIVKAEAAGLERIVRVNVSCATPAALTVTKSGPGFGTVTSQPPGINCPANCPSASARFTSGNVTLTATPAPGSSFTGWTGACSGSARECVVTMDGDRSVNAIFASGPYALLVGKTGSGTGLVTSQPPGIHCGSACSALYDTNRQVTLTAVADRDSTFDGWSGGDCAGTAPTCTLTMDRDRSATASFSRTAPAGPPVLSVTETIRTFFVTLGSPPPPGQTFTIANTGGSALVYSIAAPSFVVVSPTSGTVAAGSQTTITLQARSGLATGLHFDVLRITATTVSGESIAGGTYSIFVSVDVRASTPPSESIAGSWSGTFTITSAGWSPCVNQTRSWTATFTENNGQLGGSLSAPAANCGGAISGTLSGSTATWQAGNCGMTFRGTVSGNRLTGDFSGYDSLCENTKGTFEATRR